LDFSFFVGDVISGVGLGIFRSGNGALGPTTRANFLNTFLAETRHESLEPLMSHLAFVVRKLWPKIDN